MCTLAKWSFTLFCNLVSFNKHYTSEKLFRASLRINFTRIFKVFAKLPESRSNQGNLENFENTCK